MEIDFQAAIERARGLTEIGVGSTIRDRYVIEAPLGEGAMGQVFVALDQRSGQRVAVKVLKPGLARDPSISARFRREAESAGQLASRHTVQIIECDEIGNGSLFIAMEYVRGPSLEQIVDREGPLGLARTLRLVRQVVTALAEAHDRGIVHRDLKPANILIDTSEGTEEAKVADYGIAKLVGAAAEGMPALTAAGMTVGTPEYMAPENATGKAIDARTDLYSVGVLLFEMLEGRLPFSGDSLLMVLKAHVADPVPPMSQRVPPSVQALIERLMAKSPDHRPDSARQLLAELDAAALDAGVDLVAEDDLPTAEVSLSVVAEAARMMRLKDSEESLETIVTPALSFSQYKARGAETETAPDVPVLTTAPELRAIREMRGQRPSRSSKGAVTVAFLIAGIVAMAVLTLGVLFLAQ